METEKVNVRSAIPVVHTSSYVEENYANHIQGDRCRACAGNEVYSSSST